MIVAPSVWLEDLARSDLPVQRIDLAQRLRVTLEEALSEESIPIDSLDEAAAVWLRLRLEQRPASDPVFHGFVGPRPAETYAVSAVERYLECPFKYFASRVLRLAEERADEITMDARTSGRFVHEVFQRFFEQWQRAGRGPITPATLPRAMAEVTALVDDRLKELPEADRLVERARLLGTAAAPGLAERVFRLEAEGHAAIVERLLEWPVSGEFEFESSERRRRVALKGVVDRVDLLADGTFRVLDYKSGRAPDLRRAVQLPVYAACLSRQLADRPGGPWRLAEAAYVPLRDRRPFVRLGAAGDVEQAVAEGLSRFLGAVDRIESGAFPPQPAEVSLCAACGYSAVCRKDYVDEAALPEGVEPSGGAESPSPDR